MLKARIGTNPLVRLPRAITAGSFSAALLLGGCADLSSSLDPQMDLTANNPQARQTASPDASRTDLEKATEYWGKEYANKPSDLNASLSYARNLRALGRKPEALAVVQQAMVFHGENRQLAGEFGRLALDLNQLANAKRALEFADDPANPDWRIISARGTAFAKENNYKDAIPLYERALTLAPGQPSVLNNLALAYAMGGEASKAEEYLKRAEAMGQASPKVRENLSLVLSLQGKYDEAKVVAARSASPDATTQNTELVKKMVRLDPKPMGANGNAIAAQPDWNATVVTGTVNDAGLPWQGKTVRN